jgi:hypothetical protein
MKRGEVLMKSSAAFLSIALLAIAVTGSCQNFRRMPDASAFAEAFMKAIKAGNPEDIRALGNNPEALDDAAISYLVAETNPFPKTGLKSAHQVLKDAQVYYKIVRSERNGKHIVEIVYLPSTVAKSFNELSALIEDGSAVPFRDYLICTFDVSDGGSPRILDACGAESDHY